MNLSCPPAFIAGIAHSSAFYTRCGLSDSSFVLKASQRSIQAHLGGHRSRLVMQEASLENATEEKRKEKSDSDILKDAVLETEPEDSVPLSPKLGSQVDPASELTEAARAELSEAVEVKSETSFALESTGREVQDIGEKVASEPKSDDISSSPLHLESELVPSADFVQTVGDELPEVALRETQTAPVSDSRIEVEEAAVSNVTLETQVEDAQAVETTGDKPAEAAVTEIETLRSVESTTEEGEATATDTEKIAQEQVDDELKTEKPEEEKAEESSQAPSRQERRRQWVRKKNVTAPIASLEVGQKHTGLVKKVMSYGAFVDIGAEKDGLLHISRMRDQFVADSGEICKVGESVDVGIVSVDKEKGSFSLAIVIDGEMVGSRTESRDGSGQRRKSRSKRVKKSWEDFKFDDKVFVSGKVKTITDFGAFVELDAPADGLVHISEISNERISSVADVLSVGQEVQVRIMSIDEKRNRIALSMRKLRPLGLGDDERAPKKEEVLVPEDQPVFKTSFQLAWEKANALKNSKERIK